MYGRLLDDFAWQQQLRLAFVLSSARPGNFENMSLFFRRGSQSSGDVPTFLVALFWFAFQNEKFEEYIPLH